MIEIKEATESSAEVLALLGRITYNESHGHFIQDKNDLKKYKDVAFSLAKTKEDLSEPLNQFYIVYLDDLPVGYAKLVLKAVHDSVVSVNNCRLERIYILAEFIPLRLGQKLLDFLIVKAKTMQLDTMWLTVYGKNKRAVRFYERNDFMSIGVLDFSVNGTDYENLILSKSI